MAEPDIMRGGGWGIVAEPDIIRKNRVSGIFGIFTVIFQDATPSFLKYRHV